MVSIAWLVASCAPGEVHLSTGESELVPSGGDVGTSFEETQNGFSSGGGFGQNGPPAEPGRKEELHLTPPCVLSHTCDCADGGNDCQRCETPRDCALSAPYCDNFVGRCVECLGDQDCINRFGEFFGTCSSGRCVQCQTSESCMVGLACDKGFCGTCERNDECPVDQGCVEGHCVLEAFSPWQ